MSTEHSSTPTVVVCGSLNVDTFVRVDRFPTAGETTIASPNGSALGGKGANQAVAAARYLSGTDGPVGTVVFQATVGADADGDTALATLTGYGVDVAAVARAPQDVPTGQAFIMNDPDGENIIVVTSGANEHTDPAAQNATATADVLLAQGELTPEHSAALPQLAARLGARFVLNLAPVTTRDPALLAAADPLVLNETEAAEVFDTAPDKAAVAEAAVAAVEAGVARSVLVTLGADGAVLVTGEGRTDRTDIAPLPADSVVDTTGAGDAFCGTLAAALAEGEGLPAAARLASAAGSLSVRGRGAAPSYAGRDEVHALL